MAISVTKNEQLMQSTIASLVVVFIVTPTPVERLVRVGGSKERDKWWRKGKERRGPCRARIPTRAPGNQARLTAKMTH